jgi:hypothetical protein
MYFVENSEYYTIRHYVILIDCLIQSEPRAWSIVSQPTMLPRAPCNNNNNNNNNNNSILYYLCSKSTATRTITDTAQYRYK